ncbi:hypothetical protein, partial [Mesorhizobium sp. M4B.F.Ca.ET.049.02.1.2]|uniref:hypothetical protein n=1 Tax=Mesorhizobium sp. M4B.F.Ca.ET.049.02.1.2 TaxID=2496752 RepID=UPI001AECF992
MAAFRICCCIFAAHSAARRQTRKGRRGTFGLTHDPFRKSNPIFGVMRQEPAPESVVTARRFCDQQ